MDDMIQDVVELLLASHEEPIFFFLRGVALVEKLGGFKSLVHLHLC